MRLSELIPSDDSIAEVEVDLCVLQATAESEDEYEAEEDLHAALTILSDVDNILVRLQVSRDVKLPKKLREAILSLQAEVTTFIDQWET